MVCCSLESIDSLVSSAEVWIAVMLFCFGAVESQLDGDDGRVPFRFVVLRIMNHRMDRIKFGSRRLYFEFRIISREVRLPLRTR